VIKAPAGSNSICINGAAAHLIKPNDTVIILSYCSVEKKNVGSHSPVFVKVNNKNEIIN
jgi:aspartate 1-decarboxylase